MPDGATACQVTRITLGETYMGMLLAGKPLHLSFPPGPNPTHQFEITIDEDTRKALTGGVTDIKPKEPGPKKPKPQSTRPKKPSR